MDQVDWLLTGYFVVVLGLLAWVCIHGNRLRPLCCGKRMRLEGEGMDEVWVCRVCRRERMSP